MVFVIVVWLFVDMNFKCYTFLLQAEGSCYLTTQFAPVSGTWHPYNPSGILYKVNFR